MQQKAARLSPGAELPLALVKEALFAAQGPVRMRAQEQRISAIGASRPSPRLPANAVSPPCADPGAGTKRQISFPLALHRLPPAQRFVRFRNGGVHHFAALAGAGGQFDDITVGIAEIDRAHKTVIDRAAQLADLRFSLIQHAVESVILDAERDVQIMRILVLELERRTGHLEKSEAGAVIHLEKGVERAPFVDLESADQRKAEEILIEASGLFRIPAAIGVMMQTFDHRGPPLDVAERLPPIRLPVTSPEGGIGAINLS